MITICNLERCLIKKLAKNVDEIDCHEEYEARKETIEKTTYKVLNGIRCANLRGHVEITSRVLAVILILYEDLHTKGPWYSEDLLNFAEELSAQCKRKFDVKAEDILKQDHVSEELRQMTFSECMKNLHLKLTSTEFKKYPSLIEVYCMLMERIQGVNKMPVSVTSFPISLYLIDDYNIQYKKKGLKCCKNILNLVTSDKFEGGNYYEVIYASLKKAFMERDIELTRLVLDCLQGLLTVLPPDSDFKISTSDELFKMVLDHIESESNVYRKAALFRFVQFLIQINAVNCVNRKTFQNTVSYNLDVCCVKGVDDIMLLPIVLCLEEWVKHCWCAWQLRSGKNILAVLAKVLYTCKEDIAEKIAKITATLITLCTKEERQQIVKSLREVKERNEVLSNRFALVNKYINVN